MNEGEGKGAIDLNNCELSLEIKGRNYRLRAFSETECYLIISSAGTEVYCAIHKIEALSNSAEVPDFVQWLARGFAGIPVRYKEEAFRKAGKR